MSEVKLTKNELKPNSNKYKEKTEDRQVEKVVTTPVVVKKKSAFQKVAQEFVSDDAKNVKTYIWSEVLVPSIKKAVQDIVTGGIDMILYGGSGGSRRRSTAERVSYRNYSDPYYREPRNNQINARYSVDDIEIATRAEAEEVLDRLFELLNQYGVVRVADYKDIVGISGEYTDNKMGWTSLKNAEVIRTRSGRYAITLPRAVPID